MLENNHYLSFETMFFLSLIKDQQAFYDLIDINHPQTIQLLGISIGDYQALQANVEDLQAGHAWLTSQCDAWQKVAIEHASSLQGATEKLKKIQSHIGVRLVNRLTKRKWF